MLLLLIKIHQNFLRSFLKSYSVHLTLKKNLDLFNMSRFINSDLFYIINSQRE